jgi:hypothetical protein
MNNGKYTNRYMKLEIQRMDLLNEINNTERLIKGDGERRLCKWNKCSAFFLLMQVLTNDHKNEVSKR